MGIPPAEKLTQLETQNRRLLEALRELDVLEEIASATASEQSLDSIIELIVDKSMQCLAVEQGAVHLIGETDDQKPLRTLLRRAGSQSHQMPYHLGDQLIGWMLKKQQPLRVNDVAAERRIRVPEIPDAPIRSLLSVPLRSRGRLLGLLNVFNKKTSEGFTDEDERVLGIIAAHSAQVIQSAQLIGDLRHDRQQLTQQNLQLWREVRQKFSTGQVIGSSAKLGAVLQLVEQIQDTSVDVLITGESGTGKELIARTIHYTSPRARKAFIALNCAALPESLLEAELFGIEKGVATGVEKRIGQFEAADGGTLFLDEIGDLSPPAQAKILRVLQERVVQRLGGREQVPIDVRVLAATNKDLDAEIKQSRFREDLYYRLKVIHLQLPPLREIRIDIPVLAQYFLGKFRDEFHKGSLCLSAEAMAALAAAPWPGNVRQLGNEIKRLVICAQNSVVGVGELSPEIAGQAGLPHAAKDPAHQPLDDAVGQFERRLVQEALQSHGGNQVRTAQALGLSRQGLIKKMKRHGILGTDFRAMDR